MIAKETIDKVFDAVRVEEVIGDFVQLKKSGANFKGLSPFSDERTPSFMVSPVKQIWKDFSSGKGGNAIAFIMEHEHFTYPEAIRYLAKKYGIEIEETEQTDEAKEQANERESLYVVSEYAQEDFERNLWETSPGKAIGLSYFKERGFTDTTIRKFKLGYAIDEWEIFTKNALDKGYQLTFLEKTGLTIVKENKQFDRFKGRVMFPIHSMSGRVLGFGGRILTTSKKVAKYMNSPESDIYHKSKVLYGIYYAKQAIAKEDNCYLVEGYTDVIQFHQSGIENVVASSGTALTSDQIRLVNRLTKNITVLFDGDAAGLRASLRGVDLILEQGMNVRVCSFPEGEDPDSFARRNSYDDVITYLKENTKDFIQFKASVLVKEANNDPVKKADTIRDIVGSIAKIPDRIKQEVYLQECSRIMDISEDVLFNTLAQLQNKEVKEADKNYKKARQQKAFDVVKNDAQQLTKVDVQYLLERKIIELLLLYGERSEVFDDLVLKATDDGKLELEQQQFEARVFEKIYLDLQDDEVDFTNSIFRAVYVQLIEFFTSEKKFSIELFMQELTPEVVSEVTSILMDEEKYQLHNWESKDILVKQKDHDLGQMVNETILNLRCFLIQKRVEALKTETLQNREGNAELLEEAMHYLRLKKVLSEKLNRVI
ncbi:DNA primase [Neptunitalea chrysea]|uniref:DNA primase n=1 Tax=Neptunitalea chrysea TaxID=1647581 RepID=A0A9W6B2W3_9FLAO|nr:DNA primase [Neptunitalea chrysea]GLB51145.1 DNA primase [Neptunitalea chrysea]